MKQYRYLLQAVAIVLALMHCAVAEEPTAEVGYQHLFNGVDLTDWDADPKFWRVEDGAIVGQTTAENPTPQNTFCIWRGGILADFELLVEFKIIGGNSGIQYRSKDRGNWSVSGYQADFEAGTTWNGVAYEELGRGVLAHAGESVEVINRKKRNQLEPVGDAAEIQAVVRSEDWNEYRIVAVGNRVQQFINGVQTVEFVDLHEKHRAMEGILALQVHQGPPMQVFIKNVRLKIIEPAAAK